MGTDDTRACSSFATRLPVSVVSHEMVGRARSDARKQQDYSAIKEKWMLQAVEEYHTEKEDAKKDARKAKGAQVICSDVEERCWKEDHVRIKLHRSTMLERYKGRPSKQEYWNEETGWLNKQEQDKVVDYCIALANRGFPLTLKHIKEVGEKIARARHGDSFPEDGLGKNWSGRFLQKHSNRLSPYWTHGLDHSRARAVNPTTKEAYFELLAKVIRGDGTEEDKIVDELKYGADETGMQQGVGGRERVVGPKGQSVQHQQQGGDRENITVLCTICADGTSLPPAVIFKGEYFQTSWAQENPLNAS